MTAGNVRAICFASTAMSFFGALVVGLLRLGLPTPFPELSLMVTFVFVVTAIPAVLPSAWLADRSRLAWSLLGVALAALLLPALGLVFGSAARWLLGLVALSLFGRIVSGLRRDGIGRPLSLAGNAIVVLAAVVALLQTIALGNTAHPLAPEAALAPNFHVDTYLFSAIAQMYLKFGVPSVGLDGYEFFHYHVGSTIWYAELARLIGLSPLEAFGFGQMVVMGPLVFAAFALACGATVPRLKSPTRILTVAFGSFMFFEVMFGGAIIVSESNALATVVALLSFPFVLHLWAQEPRPNERLWRTAMLVGVCLAICALLFTIKISFGVAFLVIFFCIFLRRHQVGVVLVTFTLLGFALAFAAKRMFLYTQVSDDGIVLSFYPLVSPSETVRYSMVSLVLIAGLALAGGKSYFRSFLPRDRIVFADGSGYQFVAVCYVSLIVISLAVVKDGSDLYYALFPIQIVSWMIFLAIVFEGSAAGIGRLVRDGAGPGGILIVALLFFIALGSVLENRFFNFNDIDRPQSLLLQSVNKQSGGALYADQKKKRSSVYRGRVLRTEGAFFARDFGTYLQSMPYARAAAEVERARKDLVATGKNPDGLAVVVPTDNTEFYEAAFHGGFRDCRSSAMAIQAITGAPLLYGVPPADAPHCRRWRYGFDQYGTSTNSDNRSLDRLDQATVCEHARRWRLSHVLILASLKDSALNQVLDCAPR